jgi:hypothetical protein
VLSLDDIIAELSVKDKLQRIIWKVHEQMPEFFAPVEHKKRMEEETIELQKTVSEESFDFITRSVAPAVAYQTTALSVNSRYAISETMSLSIQNYNKPDTSYVHVPSWVKVHRAPFHTFGSQLFGLAYTATGDVHIREDLQGMQFTEVLAHEVLHQLYPSCSEQQIRQLVLARFGSAAEIHTHVCRP